MRLLPAFLRGSKKTSGASKNERAVLIESQPGGIRLLWISIGLLVMTALPHLNHIRFEIIAFFLGFALYRCLAARYRWLPRNKWIIYLFAIIAFSVSAWFYGPPLGRDPGVAFLLIMMGLKCVEMTNRRDVGIVVLLGFFTIVTQFLYADGVSWTIPLLLLVAALTWLLTQMEHAEPRPFMLTDLKLVGKMLLQALPMVVILFYLFPRLSGAFFLFQDNSDSGITGLSETLKMGTISSLMNSEKTAFVASFLDQPAPPPAERYWRGSNFWVTDGREWSRGGHGTHLIAKTPVVPPVKRFSYEIEMEPSNQDWLFSLDYPGAAPENAWLQGDYQLINRQPIKQKRRYTLDAVTPGTITPLDSTEKELSLALGDTEITDRLHQLIGTFTDGARSPAEVAQRALVYFNREQFVYTLSPPLLLSEAPVDEFVFESRRGFCGHYATSFATMMRYAGIPARVVVGYLGGELNPRSNQITVRQSDAHAWTEIWQADRGWMRVDPTAAIAPERVESSIDLGNSTNGRVLFNSSDLQGLRGLFTELGWFRDAIKAKWNRWFINFDQTRQSELLKSLGLDHLDLRVVSIIAFLLALALVSVISFALFRRDKTAVDPAKSLYLYYCSRLGKLGVTVRNGEGPRDFQQRARNQLPHLAQEIDAITDQIVAMRYGAESGDPAEDRGRMRRLDALKTRIRQMRASSRQTIA